MGKLFVPISFSDCTCGRQEKCCLADALSKRPRPTSKGVVDAYSRKPQISAMTIAYHDVLAVMKDQYAEDDDFAKVYEELSEGHRQEHYAFKEGYLLMQGRLSDKAIAG